MPRTGDALGAPLYELWQAGTVTLPKIAELYTQADDQLRTAGEGIDQPFHRPTYFSGDGYGPVHQSWARLSEVVRAVLREASASLGDAGSALCLAVYDYREQDEAARRSFDDVVREHGSRPADTKPVPRIDIALPGAGHAHG